MRENITSVVVRSLRQDFLAVVDREVLFVDKDSGAIWLFSNNPL